MCVHQKRGRLPFGSSLYSRCLRVPPGTTASSPLHRHVETPFNSRFPFAGRKFEYHFFLLIDSIRSFLSLKLTIKALGGPFWEDRQTSMVRTPGHNKITRIYAKSRSESSLRRSGGKREGAAIGKAKRVSNSSSNPETSLSFPESSGIVMPRRFSLFLFLSVFPSPAPSLEERSPFLPGAVAAENSSWNRYDDCELEMHVGSGYEKFTGLSVAAFSETLRESANSRTFDKSTPFFGCLPFPPGFVMNC